MKTKIRIEKLPGKPVAYYAVIDWTHQGLQTGDCWIGPTARTHNQAIMKACCALDRLIQRLEREWKE